ncbi:response regulator transcription factor [Patescibacteria group bacterium]|nr:response regulator transcription factor [Patescibacteria group bacterium]
MKILLCDDDKALLTIFESVLKKEGYQVTAVNDGTNALEKAQSGFDLILLDQVLPDIQGNEVLKKLKEDDKTKGIPVAILSNFGQNELIKEAMSNGATDYILKYQIEPADLVTKVKGLLKK